MYFSFIVYLLVMLVRCNDLRIAAYEDQKMSKELGTVPLFQPKMTTGQHRNQSQCARKLTSEIYKMSDSLSALKCPANLPGFDYTFRSISHHSLF